MRNPEPDLTVLVPGKPRGQGSMTLWRAPDGAERARHAPDTVAHRNLMIGLLRRNWEGDPLTGPVAVRVLAALQRPKSHLGTGKNGGRLKASAPLWATTYPDADKVARLVGDALTIAGIVADDSQIVLWRVEKRYALGAPATTIEVFALGEEGR